MNDVDLGATGFAGLRRVVGVIRALFELFADLALSLFGIRVDLLVLCTEALKK